MLHAHGPGGDPHPQLVHDLNFRPGQLNWSDYLVSVHAAGPGAQAKRGAQAAFDLIDGQIGHPDKFEILHAVSNNWKVLQLFEALKL